MKSRVQSDLSHLEPRQVLRVDGLGMKETGKDALGGSFSVLKNGRRM